MLSSVALVISMPLMLTGRNLIVFLAGYAVTYFCFNMINYAVPAAVVYLIDYEIAGQYSGYRMTLHNLGTAAFGAVSIFLLSHIGGFFTMLLAAGFQLYSGIVYYQCLKNKEKENKNKEEALYV